MGEYTAVGIRGFTVLVDSYHHMVELNIGIPSGSYRPQAGEYTFDLELFYKQWSSEGPFIPGNSLGWLEYVGPFLTPLAALGLGPIIDHYTSHDPIFNWAVFEEEGSVDMSATLVLLQFDDGDRTPVRVENSLYWAGDNLSAQSLDAVVSTPLQLP